MDLASFDGAFRELVGPGFPETALQSFDVTALARELLVLIAEASRVDVRELPVDELSEQLARCLRAVADILVVEQDGGAGWNAKWFLAVDRGADALIEAVASAHTVPHISTFAEALTEYVWAAFGLPRPADMVAWKKRHKASDFVLSLQEIWSSEEAIDLYTREMVLTGGVEASALDACRQAGWDGLDDEVVGSGSGLLGLQATVTKDGERLRAFSEISEDSFLRGAPPAKALYVLDSSAALLSASQTQPTVSLVASTEMPDGRLQTEQVTIVAPLHSRPPEDLMRATSVRVKASAAAQVETVRSLRISGQELMFDVVLRVRPAKTFSLKKVGLSLEVDSMDPLFGYLGSGSVAVHVVPPVDEGVVAIEWNSGKRTGLRLPRYEGPASRSDDEDAFGVELKPDKHYRVVVWAHDGVPASSGFSLEPMDDRSGWYVGDLLPNAGGSLKVGSREWSLAAGGASEAPHSLLVAAIYKTPVNPEDPDADVLNSLRGQLESLYAARVEDDDFTSCLGHVVLPEDRTAAIPDVNISHRGLQMASETVNYWDQGVALDADVSFDSPARQAHDAFVAQWRECVTRTDCTELGRSGVWPSKRSLRHLVQDGSIDRLLERYADLLDACAELDEMVRFRAAFPFSASVWGEVTGGVECTAVLLSPWHPLRMAWLAQTEEVLWGAERARDLAGVVEGWRFPMVGPGRAGIDRMVAVPIDSGTDQLFVGWSMLVLLATGKTLHLRAPSRAAGYAMPGSAPSGLTGTAADAAMRDFIRANQHLPSVTVDLASSAPGPRLTEIDSSVIRAVGEWSKREQPLLGVRVLDQLTREGDLPRDLLSGLFKDDLTTSVSWSRYPASLHATTPGSRPRSNLRLLQDSGVQIGYIPKPGRDGGVLAQASVRRYETASVSENSTSTTLEPGVPAGPHAFTRALRAVEGPDFAPRIRLQTAVSALLNDASDWTISGESFLSPTALAHMIANHGGNATDRMLWEWRPPFLRPTKDQSPLSRRPYVTIARVAGSLVEQVSSQVRGIVSDSNATAVPALVDDIFRTLGTRGIGLSSLLSMGGQHASGALGFYLALRLIGDMPVPSGSVQAVLPLDSCQTFLDALAPDSGVSETRRRADLLIVRVVGEEVTLAPVEIKFYGAGGEGGSLPGPGPEFAEPLEQLDATVSLLKKMQMERKRLRSNHLSHDAALWDSAMATLFEAGLRLSPNQDSGPDTVRDALEGLAQGNRTVALGRPLILFFKHQVDAGDEIETYREGSLDGHDVMSAYGAMAVRPRYALEEQAGAFDGEAQVLAKWASLVEWALTHPVREVDVGSRKPREAANSETESPRLDEEAGLGARFETDVRDTPVIVRSDLAGLPLTYRRTAGTRQEEEPGGAVSHSPDSSSSSSSSSPPPPPPPPLSSRPVPPAIFTGVDTGAAEVVSPIHETSSVASPPTGAESRETEAINHGVRFTVGSLPGSLAGQLGEYWPGNSETTQLNMGVVGDLGTGKTQLLKALMLNLRKVSREVQQDPVDCLVFDYKRDFQDKEFVDSVGATVWQPSRMPLNVLDLHEAYTKAAAYRRAAAFSTMLGRIYKGVGPVQRDALIAVIMGLYEQRSGAAPTLGEVLETYREEAAGDSVTSILNAFVLGEVFTEDRDEVISLDEAMRDTVLVIDLNSLGADSYTKNAIVVFYLDMFYERMKRMKKVPPRHTDDGVTVRNISSYLLVDEASNIMKYKFDVLDSLLKEGREFGVGTILSSQYLSHFKVQGANYAETLSTWFIHKVPNAIHTELSALGIKDANFDMAERIRGLKVHESLYRSDLSPTRFIREVPFWQLIAPE
ncbi:hypothetical protein [Janibacter sp. Soil728]|uniref:hypothetical protein n=1 Tax=Janibacter sp. Soil728 TaxID=1736393 RepID=UPI0012E7A8C9|nr:hypothetical protein [Janibacter sp. Soil728]